MTGVQLALDIPGTTPTPRGRRSAGTAPNARPHDRPHASHTRTADRRPRPIETVTIPGDLL